MDWSCIYNCSSVDDSVLMLTNILVNHSNTCFPLVRCSRKCYKDKNWINKDLKKCIAHTNKLHFKSKHRESKEDESLL